MKKSNTFTIIIPLYNCKNYLSNTINSLLKTDYPQDKLTILIIDDGSTDGSSELGQKIANENQSVKYYYKTNGNWGSVINYVKKNIKIKSDYVTVFDSDDFCKENYFRVWEYSDEDILMSSYYIYYMKKDKKRKMFFRLSFSKKSNNRSLFKSPWCHPIGKFYKKDLFLKLEDLKEGVSFLDGVVFHSLVSKGNSFHYKNIWTAFWRKDRPDNSTSAEWSKKKTQEFVYFMEKISEFGSSTVALLMLETIGLKKALKKWNIKVTINKKMDLKWFPFGIRNICKIIFKIRLGKHAKWI